MDSPSEPILASAIWTSQIPQELTGSGSSRKRSRLATECPALDDVLEGGLDYGCISCISAGHYGEARELSNALIASHLMSEPAAEAIVIDAANAVDVRRLHGSITNRLGRAGNNDASRQAKDYLERVKIMKIFDFAGMTESIGEVRNSLERHSNAPQGQRTSPAAQVDAVGGREHMLLDPPRESALAPGAAATDSRRLLVIDSITHITETMSKKDNTHGQSVLLSLMRSLRHMTVTHDICTLIVNVAAGHSQHSAHDSPSVFTGAKTKPALGGSFAQMLDLHLLVHSVPRAAGDARLVHGTQTGKSKRTAEMVCVLEILQDRYAGRNGRWALFTANPDGQLLDVA